MGRRDQNGTWMQWSELTAKSEYRGLWVALDDVRYDTVTAKPVEGYLVDADADLAALCARLQDSDHASCSVLFCQSEANTAVRRAG